MCDTAGTRARTPTVFRRGTVVTMNDAREVVPDADLLVLGDRIADVGHDLDVPPGTREIDASGGILMPGMIDSHRHMWQTVVRGLGADWTLSRYFEWFTRHRDAFRPEDVHAGNLLSALEAFEAGVTTTVDWSNGLQTVDHADAAVDALEQAHGRFVLAYGNMFGPATDWATTRRFRDFVDRRIRHRDEIGLQLAIDVTGDPGFPERPAFAVARDLDVGVTSHTGIWATLTDAPIAVMYENGVMDERNVYVHAATLSDDSYRKMADTGGTVSISAESEQHGGQGYPPTRAVQNHGIPTALSTDTSVWWSADLFSAMRATLGADRADEHAAAHRRGETLIETSLTCADVVAWATRGGARAIGRDHDLGRLEHGRKADVVLIKNDRSPASLPLLDPYGHIVLQAQRGDVHTVLIDGRAVKAEHQLVGVDLTAARRQVEQTVEHLRSRVVSTRVVR